MCKIYFLASATSDTLHSHCSFVRNMIGIKYSSVSINHILELVLPNACWMTLGKASNLLISTPKHDKKIVLHIPGASWGNNYTEQMQSYLILASHTACSILFIHSYTLKTNIC